MFNWFGKSRIINIKDLGDFQFREQEWFGCLNIENKRVEIAIDGNRKSPDEFAVEYLKKKSKCFLDFWNKAILFTQTELEIKETNFDLSKDNFSLSAISVHKENSFDDGHLVFWFNIDSDSNGNYYVSFRNELPNYLHRDN